jgi:hypothetical protein
MDNEPFVLGIYRFDESYGCWMDETTGLKLKRDDYFWLPEADLLGTLTP